MMVIFVSQCEKKSLAKTRRVLDAFANRIGDNTWQTLITEEGLKTVYKMLRKTVSKSSAVSCHWIRSRSRSQLLWVVGNKRKFNAEGVVPVNSTDSDIHIYIDQEKWQSLAIMRHAAVIAALFHDFGKTNCLFQAKLRGQRESSYEPIRHEWISLRLFQAFVGDKTDEQWLVALTDIEKNHIDIVYKDGIDIGYSNPLAHLPPFAQLVGWLVLSHHRLPVVPHWKESLKRYQEINPRELAVSNMSARVAWFEKELQVYWNSYHFKDEKAQELYEENWQFHIDGLPYKSTKWRLRAIKAADEALQAIKQVENSNILHDELFTTHLSRVALMLADHYYSSLPNPNVEWQAPNYQVYANTDQATGQLKQQLDEHLIGVSEHAASIVSALPYLKSTLLTLEDNEFLKNTKIIHPNFAWQVQAQKEAKKLSESSSKQGFFGINMASTGKGKTLANAKIMYALADKEQDCRFTVALGLRTLTLQTGQAYRTQLDLTGEQLAIAVGGAAITALFENNADKDRTAAEQFGTGSESLESFLDPDLLIDYVYSESEHSLYTWTHHNERIEKLLQAPVLVCTIDHLIPATDGTRGGKQIGPMLRLLSSDLVIDEPDDFGLEDLPALCRLIYWAGLLGSRVLLSTATMPPDLAFAAYQAYQAGWAQYAKVNIANWNGAINCAWFDEREKGGAYSAEIAEFNNYRVQHEKYVAKRVSYLEKNSKIKHKAAIFENYVNGTDIYANFAQTVLQGAIQLHRHNHEVVANKRISIGLVRMANINPIVAVAKALVQQDVPEDTHIHLCVYHSRYPLAVRSFLEKQLDRALKRNEHWPPDELMQCIENTDAKNQLFLVLASPVAEVGRDHDYDWAVIEPSSMRSIIQIAGRVLRHRDKTPTHENIYLINQNIKQLKGSARCFNRPGFEVKRLHLQLTSHKLDEVLEAEQYQIINATDRVIQAKQDPASNLVALEHRALRTELFVGPNTFNSYPAKLWWREQTHWSGVLPQRQPFRKSMKDEALYYLVKNNELIWQWKNEAAYPTKMGAPSGVGIQISESDSVKPAKGVGFWLRVNPMDIYQELADDLGLSVEEVSIRFGELRLVSYKKDDINNYYYSINFGVYQEVK